MSSNIEWLGGRYSLPFAGAEIIMEEMFKAASLLFRTAPWRRMSDQQILRIDIPQLGIDGACLSVIGGAGESFGAALQLHRRPRGLRPGHAREARQPPRAEAEERSAGSWRN